MKSGLPVSVDYACNLPQEYMSGVLVTRGMGAIAELQSADDLVEQGLKARSEEQYRRALELFEKALYVDPNHCRALFWTGFCLLPTKDYEEVINELYGNRWRVAVQRSIGYYQKLIRIIRTGDDDKIRETIRESLCLVNLGFGYDLLSNFEEGRVCYDKAIEIDNNAIAWYNIGITYTNQSKTDEAVSAFNEAITSDPEYALTWFRLGKIRKQQDEEDSAIECFASYLRYVDMDDRWEAANISYAREYLEFHTGSSDIPDDEDYFEA
ncbi:MAG: tetratricopeptide repeat protein [Chitinispirillaceae bacterium]|nr:tetratricopeptide repeat protein [Chitinispirillaceae bacterium]